MGPTKSFGESTGAYRWRWAYYCIKLVALLGPMLAIFLLINPLGENFRVNFFTLFLLFGLSIGTATAFTACIGYILGAMWSSWFERKEKREAWLAKAKLKLGFGLSLGLLSFGAYNLHQAAFTGSVLALSRRGIDVTYFEHPIHFLLAVAFWTIVPLNATYTTWRKLQNT
jgi:hypothetical protein